MCGTEMALMTDKCHLCAIMGAIMTDNWHLSVINGPVVIVKCWKEATARALRGS